MRKVRPGLPGCTLGRLLACAFIVSLTGLQSRAQTTSEGELWQQLQSQQETVPLRGSRWAWRGDRRASLNSSITILGPGTIIVETPGNVISGLGATASLTLRDVTLFYRSSSLSSIATSDAPVSSAPFPAFDGSGLSLTLANVTVMGPFRTLANVSSFWTAADLLAALKPQLPGGLGSGPQRLVSYSTAGGVAMRDVLLLPSDSRAAAVDCFEGGIPVTDSVSLRAAMDRTDGAPVFIYQDLLLMPSEFNYSRPVNLTGNRTLEVYGCPGTVVSTNYNWTRFSIQVGAGGAVSLRGLTFTDSPLVNQLFWPRFLAPLLGLVYVGVGGGCSISNATIVSPNGTDVRAYLGAFVGDTSNLTTSAQPVFTAQSASLVTISRWNVTGADVWQGSPGVSAAAAAASYWNMVNVTVETKPPGDCRPTIGQGIKVDSGLKFKQLMMDENIPAIQIISDIQLVASEWPPEASGPSGGQIFINYNTTKEVYACHPTPGQRYTIDWGNLGQVIFVFGTLRFRGSLLMTHPKPSPRRSWLYLLIGALSVETDGVIQFDGVEIRGNTSSPFTNASDPFWNYQSSCGTYCGGFIPPPGSYLNVSHYDALIFQYRFNKTEWVAVSQGKNITGAGFWGYTDVALTWRPDPSPPPPVSSDGVPVAAIAVPVAVSGALLIAAIVGLVFCLRRRRAAEATAAAVSCRTKSELSCSAGGGAGGDPMATNSTGAGGKDSCTPPQGSSATANPTATNVGPNSTTFSQGMSVLSASAPTEARIEDMKRAITAHSVLTGTHRNEQITLTELLGEGTFGKVYRGTWRGTTVAVKTMVLPTNMSGKEKREKMAVMETAISSTLSHPNIVQTYTYAILPVKGDGNQLDPGHGVLGTGASMTVDSTSPLAAMSTVEAQKVHSWEVRLVLEFCDRGSLRDVLNQSLMAALRANPRTAAAAADVEAGSEGDGGALPAPQAPPDVTGGGAGAQGPQQPSSTGAGAAAGGVVREHCPLGYGEVIDTCLDVARAMLHMHSENIVHGDLKARNILLKSGGVGDGRSYVAKVADFGLSLRIDPHESHVSNVYQGTITHMAPEVLLHGKVSKMSDVYAFAVLMWEAYTAGQAFKGTPRALLGHEVTKMNRRPQFPLDTPFEFQLLACRCWESDPSIRPTFEQIIGDLTRMRAKLAGEPLARPTGLGHPLSGSLMTAGSAAAGGGGGAAGEAAPPGGAPGAASGAIGGGAVDDSLMTASIAELPLIPGMGGMHKGHGGYGGGGYGIGGGMYGGGGQQQQHHVEMVQHSVTLNSDTGDSFPATALAGQGLFFMQGVDGSTLASMSDGMNVSPGTFTIGARPPFFVSGTGGGRPPPPMPPILEANPAQQQSPVQSSVQSPVQPPASSSFDPHPQQQQQLQQQ